MDTFEVTDEMIDEVAEYISDSPMTLERAFFNLYGVKTTVPAKIAAKFDAILFICPRCRCWKYSGYRSEHDRNLCEECSPF